MQDFNKLCEQHAERGRRIARFGMGLAAAWLLFVMGVGVFLMYMLYRVAVTQGWI